MQIHVEQSTFYDWVPLPAGKVPTPADINHQRVRQMADGGWRMRVSREANTHTACGLHEFAICQEMIREEHDGDSPSRAWAATVLFKLQMRGHGAVQGFRSLAVQDDGPQPGIMKERLEVAVKDGLIDQLQADALFANYVGNTSDVAAQMRNFFGLPASAVAAGVQP